MHMLRVCAPVNAPSLCNFPHHHQDGSESSSTDYPDGPDQKTHPHPQIPLDTENIPCDKYHVLGSGQLTLCPASKDLGKPAGTEPPSDLSTGAPFSTAQHITAKPCVLEDGHITCPGPHVNQHSDTPAKSPKVNPSSPSTSLPSEAKDPIPPAGGHLETCALHGAAPQVHSGDRQSLPGDARHRHRLHR